VRTSSSSRALDGELLRRQLASDFGGAGVFVAPAGGAITSALQQPRIQAALFGSFALVGLFLAALGLFAVASFDVALRHYELGIRAALGAHGGRLRREVIADALRPVAIGALAGLVVTWWAATLMQSLIHEIDARDPATLALVVAVLLVTAVAAAWRPARTASRLDPMEVLRRV
jgi:putative ABC transport system permease protein